MGFHRLKSPSSAFLFRASASLCVDIPRESPLNDTAAAGHGVDEEDATRDAGVRREAAHARRKDIGVEDDALFASSYSDVDHCKHRENVSKLLPTEYNASVKLFIEQR
jgi:hypothetical protein